jgi:hypothetical protein
LIVRVSEKQYSDTKKLILTFPPEHNYQLVVHDYVTFVKAVATELGLVTPERDYTSPGTYSPEDFVRRLIQTASESHDLTSSIADYHGQVANGMPAGKGQLTYRSGNSYSGEFKDGKPSGKGTFTTSAGVKVSGKFVPEASGDWWVAGDIRLSDGSTASGVIVVSADSNGGKYVGPVGGNGLGAYASQNGDFHYQDEFRNGSYDGHGVASWSDGSSYFGDFAGGTMNGKGTYRYPDGSSFFGQFSNGQPGDGTLLDSNGAVESNGAVNSSGNLGNSAHGDRFIDRSAKATVEFGPLTIERFYVPDRP